MTDGPRPAVRPNRFDAIAHQVKEQRRWYDRKNKKHLRFTEEAGIHLHRNIRSHSKETSAKTAADVEARRTNGAAHIYDVVAEEFGDDAARSIFLRVTGDWSNPAGDPGRGLTLAEFDKITEQVAIVRGQSGAVVNGVPQHRDFDLPFNKQLEASINASLTPPARPGKTPDPAGPADVFSHQMLWEMGQATYRFQGQLVSSPGVDSGYPQFKDQDWKATNGAILASKLLTLDHVREEDLSTLSAFLHRGLFDPLQGLAEEPDMPGAAGLAFTPKGDPQDLTVHCTPDYLDPGRYYFRAAMKVPLADVAASDAPADRDKLDPAQSFLRMEIAGYIDCKKPDAPVEVLTSSLQYAAIPAGTPPGAKA